MATILYFSRDYTPHDYRFLASLAETEHRVYYLRLERGPRQTEDRPVPDRIEEVLWAGGSHRVTFRFEAPYLLLHLLRVIRRVKPDLIHAGPVQTCGLLAALTGFRPLLVMSWGFDLMQDVHRGLGWNVAARYALRRATLVAGDCETAREKLIQFGVPRERTLVFPWGVDLEHFSPGSADRPAPTGFSLFCNRAWEPSYGVDVLARAFVIAASKNPDLHLLLLSGGSQAGMIRQILECGGVAGRVSFVGQVPQTSLPAYYRQADLYISPSHSDGSSVSLMEALACGLPCLVSDIPSNREWVSDGVNGWLFPDGDIEALAAAMLRAADRRKELPALGYAARQTAEEKADWKKNFQKLLVAYDQILAPENRGRRTVIC